jgi:hypothetical protein
MLRSWLNGVMTNFTPSLVALTGKSLFGLIPVFAQATGGSATSQLQQGFGTALGILFMFGFFWGVVKIWSGANAISKGDADGKMGIVAGIIIAGAAAIMGALFAIFGLSGATLTPSF